MKISLNNTTRLHPKSFTGLGENGPGSQPLTQPTNLPLKNTNEYNITATAREKSRGRTSFKGGSVESTIITGLPKWIDKAGAKIASSKGWQDFFQAITNNILMAEATFALFLTCAARPATIMATPTKDPENKQKNKYAAVKSAASGIVGFVTTFIVVQPFKKAAKKAIEILKSNDEMFSSSQISPLSHFIIDSKFKDKEPVLKYTVSEFIDGVKKVEEKVLPEKLIKKAKELVSDDDLEKMIKSIKKEFGEAIENDKLKTELYSKTKTVLKSYEKTYGNFMNKVNGPLFWPFKAAVTVALVPVILSKLGLKKSSKPAEQKQTVTQPSQIMYQAAMLSPEKPKAVFQNFAGVTNNENK